MLHPSRAFRLVAACFSSSFAPLLVAITAALLLAAPGASAAERLNFLFITVDDMSCDSIGAFGCKLPETSPNIDRLAAEGLRFEYAHVQVGNCMPSRNVMQSGRYPHNNRVEGFYQVKPDYPVLPDVLKEQGYYRAIKSKVSHSTPYSPYDWDAVLEPAERNLERNAQSFFELTQQAIAAAKSAGKPFYLVLNINDPHKPFHGEQGDNPANVPSRVFTAEEVPVPGFLVDDPAVRAELARYYSSVRRADDCAGEILRALNESGEEQRTVVMFLSDHGMALPFAKTCVYHHSTRTPWIVRWPGVTKANTVDRQHMISAVDFMPTVLDILGIDAPPGIDGRSFAPLLHGQSQTDRGWIIKEYNENSGGNRHPMRSVETPQFCYIFNPWSNGTRIFRSATMGTDTYRRMKALAPSNETVAERLEVFDHRTVEEFYDMKKDPDALVNVINDPAYQQEVARLRKVMEDWMVRTGDHALESFRNRKNPEALEAYVVKVQAESDARRAAGKQKQAAKAAKKGAAKAGAKAGKAAGKKGNAKRDDLIKLQSPQAVSAGKQVAVRVAHTIPDSLGQQLLHVTIKPADSGARIDRKVVEARGSGTVEVTFDVPQDAAGKAVEFAVFVGEDFPSCLQHIVSEPVQVR